MTVNIHLGKCKRGHPVDDTCICWPCKTIDEQEAKADAEFIERLVRVIDSGALDAAIIGAIGPWTRRLLEQSSLAAATTDREGA